MTNCAIKGLTLTSQLIREKQGVKYAPLHQENMLISWKKTGFIIFFKNTPLPMYISASNWATELIKKTKESSWSTYMGGITFQKSIYHSFPLKPGCVKNTPILWLSWLLIENLRAIFNEAPIKRFPFWHYSCWVDTI